MTRETTMEVSSRKPHLSWRAGNRCQHFFHLLYTVLKDTREKNLMPFFVTTLLYIIIIIIIINFY